MTDSATIDRTAELERKIDALTEQVQLLTEEAHAQARRRRAMEELQADLTPIAVQAIERSAYSLDGVEIDPADLLQLAVRVAENAATLDKMLAQVEALSELVADISPIVNQGVVKMIDAADQFEQRGYFEFAEAGIGVVDRIVTGYSRDDVEALGDNVVQILDIVKDLTQPEVLAVADRMLAAVKRQQTAIDQEPEKPPSLFGLLKMTNDPEVRRGLCRAMNTLKAVSAANGDTEDDDNDTPGGA